MLQNMKNVELRSHNVVSAILVTAHSDQFTPTFIPPIEQLLHCVGHL